MRLRQKVISKINMMRLSAFYRIVALCRGSWISLHAKLEMYPGGTLSIGQGVRILSGSHISVGEEGTLVLEDKVWIGRHNVIYCISRIQIGSGTRVSHFCSIIDHNYQVRTSGDYFCVPKKSEPIKIGIFNWLGAGAVLLKGVNTGDNCVIGASALLRSCHIPSGSICVRHSDKVISS